jgi:hypothetical protein
MAEKFMFSANFDNMRFSNRCLCFAIIICADFFGVQCTSKNGPAGTVLPIGLQLGISIDSAKKITQQIGWHCFQDTIEAPIYVKDNGKTILAKTERLGFDYIHIPNFKQGLMGGLVFIEDTLRELGFTVLPDNGIMNSFQEYRQFAEMIETDYGTPSRSRADLLLPVGDTTYFTEWGDRTKPGSKLYSVTFHTINGILNFNEEYVHESQ